MPTSVRLDATTESIIRRLARRTGATKSEIIREAIGRLAEDASVPLKGRTVYDDIADLVGIARGGPGSRAGRSEEILRERFSRKGARR